METVIFLTADFANVDAAQKLNILGAFNRIQGKEFPLNYPMFCLVIRLKAELGEFNRQRKLKVTLFDTDGNEKWSIGDIKFKVEVPKGQHTAEFNAIIQIQQAIFEAPGRYEYRLFVNDDLKGIYPLDVELKQSKK